MLRKNFTILVFVFVVVCGLIRQTPAQTASVLISGLSQPTKIKVALSGRVLVTETLGAPNLGRVSIIDGRGHRRTLLDGLPSGASGEGVSGPTGLDLRGRTLFVAVGEGDGVLPGPIPGTMTANPNPSSPILSSVLAVRFSADVEQTTEGFSLTIADHFALAAGAEVTLANGRGETAVVRLLADFPNSVPNPIPPFPANVRQSNPFGLVAQGDDVFVADGGMNAVMKINTASGQTQTLTSFPPRPNPLPFGPPAVEAVPTGVNFVDGQLLTTLFTGFPFAPGLSEARSVNAQNGAQTAFIGNRTTAVDVIGGRLRGSTYVLEFSTNLLGQAPGQLLYFQTPNSAPTVLAAGLISPSGMGRDPVTGTIYVAEIFTGRIIRVTIPRWIPS
jgi:hypothetical protein